MSIQKFHNKFFNAMGVFGIIVIVVAISVAIWKFLAIDFLLFGNPFELERVGVTDTGRITLKFSGGLNKQYQADIPMNYLEMQNQVANVQQVQSPIYLWTLYPTFEGYSSTNAAKFIEGYKNDSARVKFRIDYADWPLKQLEFQERNGQKGAQPLFNAHWKSNHTLSKQQPYGNPIEYVSRLNMKYKDYIYDSGDHAVLIYCFGDQISSPSTMCTAEKRWGNTRIIIQYSFKIGLLREFGNIEAGIDKLLNSFNIKEIQRD